MIETLCAVGLTFCLSAVVACGVLAAVLRYLRGRGEWVVDWLARRKWDDV